MAGEQGFELLLTAISNLHPGFFARGLLPLGPLARADEWGHHFLVHFLDFHKFQKLLLGVYRLWEVSPCSVVKSHVECIRNHVWGPLGALDMCIFIKTDILAEIALDYDHGQEER